MDTGTSTWIRTTYVVAAIQAAALTSFGLVLPFMPLYLEVLGLRDETEIAWWTGILGATSGLGLAFATPIWGALGDVFGWKPMLIRAITAGGLVFALTGFATNLQELLVLRLLHGALTGTGAAASTLVAVVSPRRRAGFAQGLVTGASQVGNFLGPLIGGVAIAAVGFRSTFLLSGLLLGVCAVAAAIFIRMPAGEPRTRLGVRPLAAALVQGFSGFADRHLRLVILAQFATFISYSAGLAFLPLYIQTIPLPQSLSPEVLVGATVATTAIAAAISTPFVGRLCDRYGPRPVLIIGTVAGAAALVPQAIALAPFTLVFLRALLGFSLAGVTTATAVLTRLTSASGAEGRAFGASLSAQMFGWGVGPLLGAVIGTSLGLFALFGLAGLLMAVVGLGAWYAPRLFTDAIPARLESASAQRGDLP